VLWHRQCRKYFAAVVIIRAGAWVLTSAADVRVTMCGVQVPNGCSQTSHATLRDVVFITQVQVRHIQLCRY
jgi:hypothetical protein